MVRLLSWLLLLGAAFPAWSQKVTIQFDKEADFARLKKYQWREHPLVAKHPEVKQYTVAAQLVQSDVNQILMDRGFVPVEENPDMFLTFFVTARNAQEVTTVPSDFFTGAYMWPYGWYGWSSTWFTAWETEVRNYLEGILLLDIVDAKEKKLVWRALGKDKIDEMKHRDENISRVVKKALKKYPPKTKS